mmetsp:Transcript_16274/g.23895  ORF Transcript_16274/g.23895 Transcript_16274/m.23895 type:complete len:108 (-) Transcript_16274:160-483(-)
MLASLFVARDGEGVMAVSNAFGSNIFDILLGMGLPFFLLTWIVHPGESLPIEDDGINSSIILMLGLLGFFIAAIVYLRLTLTRSIGYTLMGLYVLYLLYCISQYIEL